MPTFRVHLQTLTETTINVEAASAEKAAEIAQDHIYDEVHEADRSGWRATHVEAIG